MTLPGKFSEIHCSERRDTWELAPSCISQWSCVFPTLCRSSVLALPKIHSLKKKTRFAHIDIHILNQYRLKKWLLNIFKFWEFLVHRLNIKGAKFQRAQSKTSDFIKNLIGPVFFETVGSTGWSTNYWRISFCYKIRSFPSIFSNDLPKCAEIHENLFAERKVKIINLVY